MALDLEIGDFLYKNNIGKDMVLDIQIDGKSVSAWNNNPKKIKNRFNFR